MKLFISGLLVVGTSFASQDFREQKSKPRLQVDVLESNSGSNFSEQMRIVFGKKRLKGSKILKLSDEIGWCRSEKHLALLCARVAKLQYKYRDCKERQGLQEVDKGFVRQLYDIADFNEWNKQIIALSVKKFWPQAQPIHLIEELEEQVVSAPMWPYSPVFPYVPTKEYYSDEDDELVTLPHTGVELDQRSLGWRYVSSHNSSLE